MIEIIANEIRIVRGDTGFFNVGIEDSTGEPYELQEGDELRFTVRKTPTSAEKLIEKTGTEIILEPADTSGLEFGRYVYDIQLTKADGTVDTIVQPNLFEVMAEVTY